MNSKIQWFNNFVANNDNIEYVAIRDNQVICRVRREKEFGLFWVARDVNNNYLYRDHFRANIFDWVNNKFN